MSTNRGLVAILALAMAGAAPACSVDGNGDDSGGGGGGGEGGGGEGGGGEGGGGGEASFCAEECSAKADCQQSPVEFDCVGGRCVADLGESGGCSADAECHALFSGWATDCTGDGDCTGQVCIDTGGGAGKCATQPSEFLTCDQLMTVELSMPALGGGGDVTVCGNDSAKCNLDGDYCFDPCTSDDDCLDSNHPKCNTGTGLCGCTDSSCTDYGDVCTSTGFCGCSSAAACPSETNHPGTSWVCE